MLSAPNPLVKAKSHSTCNHGPVLDIRKHVLDGKYFVQILLEATIDEINEMVNVWLAKKGVSQPKASLPQEGEAAPSGGHAGAGSGPVM